MNDHIFSALDPFGRALVSYWQGNQSARLIHEYDTGTKISIPVSVFFRSGKDFFPTENVLEYCRDRILAVGAGTGVHALELEQMGYAVTAVDVNSHAVQIMQERGVRDVRHSDFFAFSGETYDTILMLGHNIGICGTIDRLSMLLQKCKSLLKKNGQLLVNSVDESNSHDASDRQGYAGDLKFRLSYEGVSGPWMHWLHVDFDTLSLHADKCGWLAEKLIETEKGEYFARLTPG